MKETIEIFNNLIDSLDEGVIGVTLDVFGNASIQTNEVCFLASTYPNKIRTRRHSENFSCVYTRWGSIEVFYLSHDNDEEGTL